MVIKLTEIVNADVITRLRKRFILRDYAVDPNLILELLKVVQPVTSVDELLRTPQQDSASADLDDAVDHVMFTVPDGKRWTLRAATLPATASATYLKFKTDSGDIAQNYGLGRTAGGLQQFEGMKLNQGGQILLAGTNNVADTGKEMILFYEEEDSFA